MHRAVSRENQTVDRERLATVDSPRREVYMPISQCEPTPHPKLPECSDYTNQTYNGLFHGSRFRFHECSALGG